MKTPVARRAFLAAAGAAALATAWAIRDRRDASREEAELMLDLSMADGGRLTAVVQPPGSSSSPGLHALGLDGRRDALLYVPAGYTPGRPWPLAVLLHGAFADAERGLELLRSQADAAGLILLAPPSRGRTWDLVGEGFGPDVTFIDAALKQTFGLCAIDPRRLLIGGFSDGASYALSLGLTNGDLFTHVAAFSPGYAGPARRHGRPRLFISHGLGDGVLPIDRCSRKIATLMRDAGYDVAYREFEGSHVVPPEIAREAVDWFLAG